MAETATISRVCNEPCCEQHYWILIQGSADGLRPRVQKARGGPLAVEGAPAVHGRLERMVKVREELKEHWEIAVESHANQYNNCHKEMNLKVNQLVMISTRNWKIKFKKSAKVLGTVRICLPTLVQSTPCEINQIEIDRLLSLLQGYEEVDWKSRMFRVQAIIAEPHLDLALLQNGVTRDQIKCENPDAPPITLDPTLISCIRGHELIEAANQFYKDRTATWIVDLFPPGLSFQQFPFTPFC